MKVREGIHLEIFFVCRARSKVKSVLRVRLTEEEWSKGAKGAPSGGLGRLTSFVTFPSGDLEIRERPWPDKRTNPNVRQLPQPDIEMKSDFNR